MERNELIKLINETEKRFEKNKLKRAGVSFLSLFFVNFMLVGLIEGFFENITINTLVDTAILAFVYTVILFFVSAIIFSHLFNMNHREENYLKELNKKLSEME